MLTPSRKQQILSIVPMYRALYLNQSVFTYPEWNHCEPMHRAWLEFENCILSLRSVKDLTDEEAIHVASISYRGKSHHTAEVGRHVAESLFEDDAVFFNPYLWTAVIFYLASIGIALPYYTATTGLITVEEFIEAGTLVIKS